MNYSLTVRKFITSQYLYTGIRITAGVLIPGLVLYHYGALVPMMGIPLGAIFIAFVDNPGPLHHRINGMVAGIILNFLVVCISGLSHWYPLLISFEIIIFSFLFSMFAVYGNRANSIGLIGLIVFIITYGSAESSSHFFYNALYFSAGGIWYAIFSIASNTIRPFTPVQQLLGESLIETGSYLHAKALFYNKEVDSAKIFPQLIQHQVTIQQQQNDLREMLFKTRLFLTESTIKGRRLMMIFLDSIDLLERIMTSQQDYAQLHREFDNTNILEQYQNNIIVLANALHNTGLAVQGGYAYKNETELDMAAERSRDVFLQLRREQLHAGNVEGFIKLRHILYSISDITERIKRIQAYTSYKQNISSQITKDEAQKFVSHQDFNLRLLLSNLTLKSSQFRHSLRLTIAMAGGYTVSLLFPLGHGYWILLTIATIIKPAYSISRKRNIERVAGTLIGVLTGFLTLYFSKSDTPVFIVMLFAMLTAYSFLRLQFLVSTASITLYVLLSFHFLYPTALGSVLTDRILDTAIGSAIAFASSYFILPAWEHEQINKLLHEALQANKNYFKAVAGIFTKTTAIIPYKLARKEAFVSLANLSDALQRMLSEPKSHQHNLQQYHQLVTANHMLTSYIASLSYYAQQYGEKYGSKDFMPMINYITNQFDTAIRLLEKQNNISISSDKFPINKKVQRLLEQRRRDMESGIESDVNTVRKTLSEMKTITDQLQLISSIVTDEIKVIQQLRLA